jgi:hypothetical protein
MRSTHRQPPKIAGPTVTLLNTDERVVTEKDEQNHNTTSYLYTQYRFDTGEIELVMVGILPDGAEWDETLRSIERSALYDEADIKISKYSTDAADSRMRDRWIAYKAAVRATPSQRTYPASVEYPETPE